MPLNDVRRVKNTIIM